MAGQPTDADWAALREREACLLELANIPVAAHDIEHPGGPIHFLTVGSPDLPPLVMLHGRGSSSALWFPILKLLAPERFLVAIDMPGWGLSTRAPFTGNDGQAAVNWWRDGVLAAIDALGLLSYDLLGHSLGGMVAMAVALERPAQVEHLLLEDAAGFARAIPFPVRLYFNLAPERLARAVPRFAFNAASRSSVPVAVTSRAQQRAIFDYLHTLTTFPGTLRSGAHAFDMLLGLAGVKFSFRDRVHSIATSTCLLWGAADGVVPFSAGEDAIATMPHTELVMFPGVGHSPHFEQPDAFALAVRHFIAVPATIR